MAAQEADPVRDEFLLRLVRGLAALLGQVVDLAKEYVDQCAVLQGKSDVAAEQVVESVVGAACAAPGLRDKELQPLGASGDG